MQLRLSLRLPFRDWQEASLCCLLVLASLSVSSAGELGNCSLCTFTKHRNDPGSDALSRLKPLCGKRLSIQATESHKYSYDVGICAGSIYNNVPALKNAAVVQDETKEKGQDPDRKNLGSFTNAELMAGENWIYLEYENGESYKTHCGNEPRRSIIMITCKPGEMIGDIRLLEENSNMTEECHYLFELGHDAACSVPTDSGLSAGSVICIILGTVVGAYLVFGGLYMRLCRGAKGWHQIPNYEFWRDFGNLQADGCDLICRCGGGGAGGREREGKQYHGIGDHQIESANDDDHDEHLLPM